MPINHSRRQFFRQATAVSAVSAGIGLGLAPNSILAGTAAAGNKTLVYIFLSGGMDGLSLIPPISGQDLGFYMDARDRIVIDPDVDAPFDLNGHFGLHPFCDGFYELYQAGHLAVIQAAGHPMEHLTRSHFDSQEQIELGTPGEQTVQQGWLTRLLATQPTHGEGLFSALVSDSNPPVSLNEHPGILTLDSASGYHPNAFSTYSRTHLDVLRRLYNGTGDLDLAGRSTLDAVDLIQSLDLASYVPGGATEYEETEVSGDMRLIAQLIRKDLGISVATVNFGGWDDHNDLNVTYPYGGFGVRMQQLSNAIRSFYNDLAGVGRGEDVTVVVQTEFGRQVKENANFGLDHGLGAPMLVIGGGVSGGQVYGDFPGIAPFQRISDSVIPTVDFRQVLATVSDRMMGNPNIEQIFPGLDYQPMNFA